MAIEQPPQFQPTWFGRYVLLTRLAEGGMAEIYLAVEQTSHAGRRFVILKRIHRDYSEDADYIEYFLTEGRVSLKFAHPNLPQAYELGIANGVYYLAMEYIRGASLLDLVRAARKAQTRLSVSTVMTIACAVAAALEHAHGLRDVDGEPLQVVHRDVTPQNIMATFDGGVKLIDFGIAQATVQTHKTQSGIVKGKLSYLAPEQIEQPSTVDHRADLFALGICMHEALTLRPLFRARTDRETVARVLRGPIPALDGVRPDLPPGLGDVVARALARRPDDRYPSAAALLADLERVAELSGVALSMGRLRHEVNRLCTKPEEYQLGQAELIALQTPPPPDTDSAAARAPAAPAAGGSDEFAVANQVRGLARDPALVYFLRQAGAHIPPSRPQRLRATHPDAELALLLAALER